MRVGFITLNSPYHTQQRVVKPLNFGAKLQCPNSPAPDTFEVLLTSLNENKQFCALIESIYAKYQKKLYLFSPQKLETAIKNILKSFPDLSEKEVLTAMQKLTQWANYTCLPNLSEMLAENNIGRICTSTPTNIFFNYFQHSKRLFPEQHDKPLTGFIVTMEEFNNYLYRHSTNLRNTTFVNLEGFDHGVNLFRDDNLLESLTKKILTRAQIIKQKYPQKTFDNTLFLALNGNLITLMKILGYKEPITFRIDAEPTRETILKQMSPFYPQSKDDLRLTIETVAKYFTNNNQEYKILRNNIADYYESKLDVYTKQRLIESLKYMKKYIDNYTARKQISPENVFYLIPTDKNLTKSFSIITHMYQEIFNINPDKILKTDNISEINGYPSNSAFVILDDFAASGTSFVEAADYYKLASELEPDKHILFCPLVAHREGLDKIKEIISFSKRSGSDTILTIKSHIKDRLMTARDVRRDKYFYEDQTGIMALGYEGFNGEYGSISDCTVFPYMSPDNNADLASFITRYFLPSEAAISNKHLNFQEINFKLNIKKNKKD